MTTIPRLTLLLTLVASGLAAQSSVHQRLAARLPGPALAVVESLIVRGMEDGLPPDPLIAKALEGAAKGAAPDRIAAAVRLERAALRDAQLLVLHAGALPPITPLEVAMVAYALRRDVPPSVIEALITAQPGEPRGASLHAVADLISQGVDPDDAYQLVTAGLREGLRDGQLFELARQVRYEMERGRSAADAMARVRARQDSGKR